MGANVYMTCPQIIIKWSFKEFSIKSIWVEITNQAIRNFSFYLAKLGLRRDSYQPGVMVYHTARR